MFTFKGNNKIILQDPNSYIPCSDSNGIPIIKEVVFGGITCIPDTSYPCNPCRINANALSSQIIEINSDHLST